VAQISPSIGVPTNFESAVEKHLNPFGGTRMTVFVIVDVKVTDESWIPAYAKDVHNIVHKHGGRYLTRTGNVKTLEGPPLDTTIVALLEFPTIEAVQAFATDPDYAPHAMARHAGSISRLHVLDATDIAGTVEYLK
jgi:uncharacterized protein (DUF1330 family)